MWNEDNPFPVEIDFGMKDVLLSLRPKLKPYKSLQEAADAVENLEKELMNKLTQAVRSSSSSYMTTNLNHVECFFQMPEWNANQDLSDTLACIEEEVCCMS